MGESSPKRRGRSSTDRKSGKRGLEASDSKSSKGSKVEAIEAEESTERHKSTKRSSSKHRRSRSRDRDRLERITTATIKTKRKVRPKHEKVVNRSVEFHFGRLFVFLSVIAALLFVDTSMLTSNYKAISNLSSYGLQEMTSLKPEEPTQKVVAVEKPDSSQERTQETSIDLKHGCPIDLHSEETTIRFYGYEPFTKNRSNFPTLDYFTGIIECRNCAEHNLLFSKDIPEDAEMNLPFITTAKCHVVDCPSILASKKDVKKDNVGAKEILDNCERGFDFQCSFGITANPTVYNFINEDDAFEFTVTPEDVICRHAGGYGGSSVVDCPPCKLLVSMAPKFGWGRFILDFFQFTMFTGAIGFLLYTIGMRFVNRPGSKESVSEEDSEDEESDDSDLDLVEKKTDAKAKLGTIDFSSPPSRSRKVVTEAEFQEMQERGETKGKKISKIEISSNAT